MGRSNIDKQVLPRNLLFPIRRSWPSLCAKCCPQWTRAIELSTPNIRDQHPVTKVNWQKVSLGIYHYVVYLLSFVAQSRQPVYRRTTRKLAHNRSINIARYLP